MRIGVASQDGDVISARLGEREREITSVDLGTSICGGREAVNNLKDPHTPSVRRSSRPSRAARAPRY